VTADILAIKLISTLKDNGVNVPNDISVIGFDDLYISKFISPKLTTISQDILLKGRVAAKLVIDTIEGNSIDSKEIILPVSLIKRDSVKGVK
ncbi:substrate-binding domain-containing protein, partial [Clostridium sp.]|uniref:substrate-binding domain-containing protein n=1 Tax=Clostridium sp. TaxID=1506 RepID=UPI003F3A50C6